MERRKWENRCSTPNISPEIHNALLLTGVFLCHVKQTFISWKTDRPWGAVDRSGINSAGRVLFILRWCLRLRSCTVADVTTVLQSFYDRKGGWPLRSAVWHLHKPNSVLSFLFLAVSLCFEWCLLLRGFSKPLNALRKPVNRQFPRERERGTKDSKTSFKYFGYSVEAWNLGNINCIKLVK